MTSRATAHEELARKQGESLEFRLCHFWVFEILRLAQPVLWPESDVKLKEELDNGYRVMHEV